MNIKALTTIIFFFAIQTSLYAQNYDVDLIPSELKSYAKVVVREDKRTLEIKSDNDAIYHVKRVFTILNNTGEDFAESAITYQKSHKIKSLSLQIYNENGQLISKIKESDFKDKSYISDFSLYEDVRIKSFTPLINKYPVTIALEFELKLNQTFILPDWYPQSQDGVSVQLSEFSLIKAPSFKMNYYYWLIDKKPEIITEKDKEISKWKLENLLAFKSEPYSKTAEERLPNLKMSAIDFSYENIKGSFTDWNSYGKWFYDNLLKNRSDLSQQTKEKVKSMVKDAASKKEAAKIIYEYVQKKNRYISVQVGIGGFQPMKASEVDNLSYGDCKALTMYTLALLEAVNIPAYYTEINAGDSKIDYIKDYASGGQGNHVILCVPFEKDSVWLECTSKDAPFGFLGSFTNDRNAVLITENGGFLVKTPKYSGLDNTQSRKATLIVNENGELDGNIQTVFSGLQFENREGVLDLTPTEKESRIKSFYKLTNLNILSYKLDAHKRAIPSYEEQLSFKAYNFAGINNNMMSFKLNPFNESSYTPKEVRNRKNEVYIKEGYIDIDSIFFQIPKNYKIEYLPSEINYKSQFGEYSIKSLQNNDQIIFIRAISIKEGTYPSESYDELIDFYKKISSNDAAKCILKRSGA